MSLLCFDVAFLSFVEGFLSVFPIKVRDIEGLQRARFLEARLEVERWALLIWTKPALMHRCGWKRKKGRFAETAEFCFE